MIVGIVGFSGSGKDTLADYLIEKYNFRKLSFAGALKDALSHIFGWDRDLLEGKTMESRKWREQVDEWWSKRLGIENLTPRMMLQRFGTDVCREHFHDSLWVASLENKLRKTSENVVITDCRFPNEIQAVKDAGGKIIRTKRGCDPEWFELAKLVNCSDQSSIAWSRSSDVMKTCGIHYSEWAWIGTKFDIVVANDGTIDDLYKCAENLVFLAKEDVKQSDF